MFYSPIPIRPKVIESNGVGVWIQEIEELAFEFDALSGVDFTFKDGILDSLPVVESDFGSSSEATLSGFVFGGDVVG